MGRWSLMEEEKRRLRKMESDGRGECSSCHVMRDQEVVRECMQSAFSWDSYFWAAPFGSGSHSLQLILPGNAGTESTSVSPRGCENQSHHVTLEFSFLLSLNNNNIELPCTV